MRRSSPELTATHRSHETCDPLPWIRRQPDEQQHARVAATARVSTSIEGKVDPAGPNETKNITPCVGWLDGSINVCVCRVDLHHPPKSTVTCVESCLLRTRDNKFACGRRRRGGVGWCVVFCRRKENDFFSFFSFFLTRLLQWWPPLPSLVSVCSLRHGAGRLCRKTGACRMWSRKFLCRTASRVQA